ncbi:MAG TPA: FKBP-type peptidyl-prolyl cis-trans isomerase [Micromonosporaceae bacterium]
MAVAVLAGCGSSGANPSPAPTAQAISLGGCILHISVDLSAAPTYTIPKCNSMPQTLTSLVVVQGVGAPITVGQNVTTQYVAYDWTTGKQVASSWTDGKPMKVTNIGQNLTVPPGINFTLTGKNGGGRYVLLIPPDMTGDHKVPGVGDDDTLLYIADPAAPVT